MNIKVKEFIDKMKEAERVENERKKEELLLSLGLCETTIKRRYSDNWGYGFEQYDTEKGVYYSDEETTVPIEITDEEYREILKYADVFKKQNKLKRGFSIYEIISIIAKVGALLNIFIGIILFAFVDSDLMWVPIFMIISGCVYYPLVEGYSRIVAAAEKILKENGNNL